MAESTLALLIKAGCLLIARPCPRIAIVQSGKVVQEHAP